MLDHGWHIPPQYILPLISHHYMYKAFIVTSGLLAGLATTTAAQTQSDALTAPAGVSRRVVRFGSVPPEKHA